MGAPTMNQPPVYPQMSDWDPNNAAGPESYAAPLQPPAFAIFAFWVFVVGGLGFAWLFLSNWSSLLRRPEMTVDVPIAGQVSIGSLSSPLVSIPQRVEEIRQNPAAVAVNLLPDWKGTDRINIVLLGIDRRPEETLDGTRSDTIMLLSIDPVAKSAALVSLPRDMWVPIPGYGEQRINVAHAVGGPALTKRTIASNFGMNVQYYARVDFRGFEDVVNTVGGVFIDVERPISDNEYPGENYSYQRIYIEPGPQLMVGQTALQYARSRHTTNDFDRAARQQRVVVAVRDRALQLNMLPRAAELLDSVLKAVDTDVPSSDLLPLAKLASQIERDKIVSLVIDSEYVTPFVSGGADLLAPNTAAIRQAIDRALRSAAHPELKGRIEVLNGSGRPGLAQQAADYLTARGFEVVRIAQADRNDYPTSAVTVLTGNRTLAEAASNLLGLTPTMITEAEARGATADTRIVLGQDFTLPR